MSEEELYKALKIFNREDLTYENDDFCNDFEEYMNTMKQEKAIEVFMSIEDMIKYSKLEQEIERLNNIINELEKWLEEQRYYYYEYYYYSDFNAYGSKCDDVLDKLQELKGSDE